MTEARFISTRGAAPAVALGAALAAGLAPDGGLYVPEAVAPLPAGALDDLRGASFADVAVRLARHLLGGALPDDVLESAIRGALDFEVPLVPVDEGVWALETFHGPTFAFKDVGARVMARLLAATREGADPVTILVATSGDTGSAVAQAFHGVAGTRVVVLYPDGQVTAVQEAQFATLGGNVTALAVAGTFDDCQRLAKEAFADPALRARVRLTSANSISIGRLLPQAFYYVHGVLQLPAGVSAPVVAVPSGNFGNLTAGVLAERLGLPVSRWVAATTVNDTVPRYLTSGRFEPRPSVSTLANAMDVGNPSNLERLRWMFGDDLDAMRARLTGSVHTDAEVRQAIGDLWRRRHYLADPHSAIAWLGLQATRRTGEPGIFVSTAHPAKFREAVEPAIGDTVPLPGPLAEAVQRPRQITRIAPTLDAVAEHL
ncbi:MAG: threonine synthase [Vicinamibacterales bacterium]